MKEFLSREGVPFVAKNVDEDEQAYAELIAKGYRTIPVTFVGDTAIRGYDEAALREAMARNARNTRNSRKRTDR